MSKYLIDFFDVGRELVDIIDGWYFLNWKFLFFFFVRGKKIKYGYIKII